MEHTEWTMVDKGEFFLPTYADRCGRIIDIGGKNAEVVAQCNKALQRRRSKSGRCIAVDQECLLRYDSRIFVKLGQN